ncbi:mechanosensitive ion channel family protein [Sphingobacterium sp. SGG-5]|uniref:mechanosensitive ion channel family protein n=1 Tax=Sphingobacterium sp. SGG-5 TaxID=2710881 RepID=UPI0013EC713E|nr:mechanosensitive ion channel family protein [Sphingobacterium sp. SGG-5]NGM61690.1 mechanosensitive ion channel family protein [Sphingobacterium sp. SGG-5]
MIFSQHIYFGNSVKDYLVALGIVIIGLIILTIVKAVLIKRLHRFALKTESDIDDIAVKILQKGVFPLLYFILIFSVVLTLNLPDFLHDALRVARAIIVVFYAVRILNLCIDKGIEYYLKKQGRLETKQAMSGVTIIIQLVLWCLGLVFLLGNLGYNVVTLLTGLGIGGIAIALAAQSILGDIFAYFSILFDRPFEVGEFLIIGDQLGTVSYIGIKTTRIRSLSGHEIAYSNQNLLNEWINNYSRMEKRRAVFGFNVSYNTSPDKLEQIPEKVKEIILAQDKVTFDRVHLAAFKEYAIYYEAVYYSMEPGYTEYMDKQQKINLAICRLLNEMGVSFAYSTSRQVEIQKSEMTEKF